MKNWLAIVLVGLAFAVPALGIIYQGERGMKALLWDVQEVFAPSLSSVKHASINYGVYDPLFEPASKRAFEDATQVRIEHIFVSWLYPEVTSDGASIGEMFSYARERDRWLMVTVEPHSDGRTLVEGGFLEQVAAGAYDDRIEVTCRGLGDLQVPLFVRWGHEMEIQQERYPWSGQAPEEYIAAYRHFVRSCRQWIEEGYYVWSPLGRENLADYWPGRLYADYVGFSTYGLLSLDLEVAGRPRSFVEIFAVQYARAVAFNRPVMIAELGVEGEPSYQQWWMRGLFRNAHRFPLLKTAVYFNAQDVVEWAEGWGLPDWRIAGDIFE